MLMRGGALEAYSLSTKSGYRSVSPKPAAGAWREFRVGSSFIVLWGGGGTIGTDPPFVYVDDLDSHFKHAEAAGASIVSPITEHGFRSYTAADREGRHWVFAQSGPRLGR